MKKSDSELQQDAMGELEWDACVDHSKIGVAAAIVKVDEHVLVSA